MSSILKTALNLSFCRFTVLLAVLLGVVLLIGCVSSYYTNLTVYESMSIIGVFASITLSAILAYLYYRMSRTQDLQRQEAVRQADLQAELPEHQENRTG